jgi:hypothetical protein
MPAINNADISTLDQFKALLQKRGKVAPNMVDILAKLFADITKIDSKADSNTAKPGKGKDGRLKICILTTGPGKTMGDASLCEKLAASLLEKYNIEIDTRLHLIEDGQKDKVRNIFNKLEQDHPGQHNLTVESGNLDYNHAGFDPNEYDLVIPFAAYNLFEDDFKLKTQFFSEKPNVGFIKCDDAQSLIKTDHFAQHTKQFNGEHSLITFIEQGSDTDRKYFAYIKDNNGQDNLIVLDQTQASLLKQYFNPLESNIYHAFDNKDLVRAPDFEIKDTELGAKILQSKRPSADKDKKAQHFNPAFELQTLVKDLATKHLGNACKDKCVYLTRYDFFSDEYLASLKENDLELLGIDRGDKDKFGEMFVGGKIQNVQTGFGKHKHGIMLPQVPNAVSLDSVEAIKSNMEAEDTGVIDLLFGNKSKQDFEQSNELFFGYHNIIPNTDISALPIKGYIKTCLDITDKTPEKTNKNVDFVLNIYPDDGDASNTCKISEVLQGIDLNKYDVEFWKKNTENKLEKAKTVGDCDGKKPIVRLINPFGMKHKSFLTVLRLAHPFTLQTGNSSIIEAFYLGKMPLYQLTTWSTDFLNALEQYVNDTLGKDAHYATIFRTANDNNIALDEKVKIISELYRNHGPALTAELAKLDTAMKNEMNLYNNFPKLLKDQFQVPLTEYAATQAVSAPASKAALPAPIINTPIINNPIVAPEQNKFLGHGRNNQEFIDRWAQKRQVRR